MATLILKKYLLNIKKKAFKYILSFFFSHAALAILSAEISNYYPALKLKKSATTIHIPQENNLTCHLQALTHQLLAVKSIYGFPFATAHKSKANQ